MAGDLDVKLKVQVDATGDGARAVADDLARVEQAAVGAQQEIAAAATAAAEAAEAATEDVQALAAGLEQAGASAEQSGEASEAAAGGMQVLAEAIRDAGTAAAEQSSASAGAAAGLHAMAEAGGQVASAQAVVADGLKRLAAETAQLSQATDQQSDANKRLSDTEDEVARKLREQAEAARKAAEEQKKLRDAIRESGGGFKAFSVALDAANQAASSHLATAAHLKQAAEPILGASRKILGTTWGVAQSGIGLDAMLGDAAAASGMDYSALSSMAASVAGGSTRSQTDVAAAVQALAKRGFGADRITESALSDVVRFSNVTGMGTTDAAGMLASAANGTGEDLGRMANMLLSARDPATIGRLFSLVGPKARAAGFGATDISLLTETLSQRGYEGERAGEALNGMFLAVNDPNRKKYMRRLGVTGKESGAAEMLSNISAKTAGMDEKRLAKLLRDAFGEGAPAITALLTDVESLKKRDAELRDDGYLAATAKLKEETTDGAARALEGLAASVARLNESLTKNAIVQGALTTAIKAISGVVDAMAWMAEHCPAISAITVGLAGGLGALLAALGGVAVVGSAISTITGLKKYLETMRVLDASLLKSSGASRMTARGIGMAAAKFAVVAYAAELLTKNFDVVKGAIIGFIGHFQGLSVRFDEWIWNLGKSIRELFGINDSEEKDAAMRAEFEERKQSALAKLQQGQDAMAASEAAGGFWAAMNPADATYAQKTQSYMAKAKKEREAQQKADGQTSIAISVKNDTVQTQVSKDGKTMTLDARTGLVAAGVL